MRKPFPAQGRTKSPCFGCKDRSVGCHAHCKQYKNYRNIHDDEVLLIRENRKKAISGKVTWRDAKSFKNAGKQGKNKVFKQTMK